MKKNNNGFTLIEMLVVVVLMGILLTLAVPSMMNLINDHSSKQYNTYVKVLNEGMNLYTMQHKGELLNINNTCIKVSYDSLKQEDLIKENGVFCTGNIIITKIANNNFKWDYYLTCKDKNNKVLKTSETMPTGCSNME